MVNLNRRAILGGIAATAMARPALASAKTVLRVESRVLEVNGKPAKVWSIVNTQGGIGHSLAVNESFSVRLENAIDQETLVHWHGLTPPIEQDGVAHLSQPPIKPGAAHDYDFRVDRPGTFWMHSHMGLQEQRLLAAPLIVREAKAAAEQEHVVMLHDFTFREPEEILAELRGGGGAHAAHGAAAGGMDHSTMDHSKMDHSKMSGGEMAASPAAMLNDIVFDAYLANDRTLADPEVVQVEKGGSLRLRIINASAATNMWVDLGPLEGELIAVDGHAIAPLKGSRFPLAIAQRADVRVAIPAEGGAFLVQFRAEGLSARSGVYLASKGAAISQVAVEGDVAPAVDLAFEAQYRAAVPFAQEPVTRTEMLMLTGGGADYQWGLNGKSSMHDRLFSVREGERIDVMMHNMTSMSHPMHLHGHLFKVVNINGTVVDGAVRDTVLVPPNQFVTIRFDANNPGNWAFHCHHMYHMNAGMMGVVGYSSAA